MVVLSLSLLGIFIKHYVAFLHYITSDGCLGCEWTSLTKPSNQSNTFTLECADNSLTST
jgi:hypothetical protein